MGQVRIDDYLTLYVYMYEYIHNIYICIRVYDAKNYFFPMRLYLDLTKVLICVDFNYFCKDLLHALMVNDEILMADAVLNVYMYI